MGSLNWIGGVSGALAGVLLLLTLLTGIPVYASAPSELFSTPLNIEMALAFSAGWAPSQRLAFKTLLGSQIAAHALMLPALLALYGVLKATRHAHALIGMALAAFGIGLNFLDALLGFPLAGSFGEHYTAASAAERAAMVTLIRFLQDFPVLTVAWLFLGAGAILSALAMLRSAFPRWLAWLALIMGVAGLATVLNQLVVFLPNILAIAWFPLLGMQLYRRNAADGT